MRGEKRQLLNGNPIESLLCLLKPGQLTLLLLLLLRSALQDEGRLGVYATAAGPRRASSLAGSPGWLGRLKGWVAPWAGTGTVTLAAFPLSTVLTAGNLTTAAAAAAAAAGAAGDAAPAPPAAGAVGTSAEEASLLREMLDLGVIDDRSAVILHLAVHRRQWQQQQQLGQRGTQDGGLGPWLALLPASFSTPLFFTDAGQCCCSRLCQAGRPLLRCLSLTACCWLDGALALVPRSCALLLCLWFMQSWRPAGAHRCRCCRRLRLQHLLLLLLATAAVAAAACWALCCRSGLAARHHASHGGEVRPLLPWLLLLLAACACSCCGCLLWVPAPLSPNLPPTLRGRRVRRRALESSWRRLEPAARQLAAATAVGPTPTTLDDFLWAHSVFWSRSIAFPSPAGGGGGSSRGVEMQEGIVPGLDFCNHATGSPCRWTVYGAPPPRGGGSGGGGAPSAVSLVCPRGGRGAPRAGQEVTISYGDKSNEELLFLYGGWVQHTRKP